MNQKVPMTSQGAEKLRDELKRRKSEDRYRIVAAIEEARAHGDLSENAEYHAAKEQQAFNEGRIAEIENALASAEVIDTSRLKGDRVVFGVKVTVMDEDSEDETTYHIVGVDEADLDSGKISYSSPMARAMIGKEEGDQFEVKAPGGARHYEVVEIAI
uniref:Transcription elongation factor GreA n=1 Tax=Magnetococcus massalia (strain MO-1) TaxID=451514 RepID=A0A1S7LJB4_MAGMO|nr:Transcription elongation factor [Candidatus Magnetococcus massalia]